MFGNYLVSLNCYLTNTCIIECTRQIVIISHSRTSCWLCEQEKLFF